ncbi:L domain-like protein [Fragilariopsis cylindrus CCMP1102]|uniref:L domain-like protein n=1 Tax=Fragilariopsis cylindrus CCMP1102 TaxID=635003 RepID=A0A1E7EY85_9STRA|nr:L domain-like protein [Fragilariopsis cylindrus CCMP1102]|eukprot:OEU10980.1 L domain-like protein [Fragilariopsis cylindrus CCMP1102]
MDVTEGIRSEFLSDDISAQSPQMQPPLEEIRTAEINGGMSPMEDQSNLSYASNSAFDDASSPEERNSISHDSNGDHYDYQQGENTQPNQDNNRICDGVEFNALSHEESHNQPNQNITGFCDGVAAFHAPTQNDLRMNHMLHTEEDDYTHYPNLKYASIYEAVKLLSILLILYFTWDWGFIVGKRSAVAANNNKAMDCPKHSPFVERSIRAWECGTKITNEQYNSIPYLRSNNDDDKITLDGPRERAITWFVIGAGRNINLDDDCTSRDSLFSILYSLLVLRESTGVSDPDWHTNASVQNASDVCKWSRVHCSGEILIEKLIFNNADLDGTIPPELMRLTNLTYLGFNTNQRLHGFIPASINQLTNLEYLHLQDTGLSGELPIGTGGLTSLRTFYFDNTPLLVGTMPEGICKLTEGGGQLESLRGTCGSRIFESCSCCTSCKQPIVAAAVQKVDNKTTTLFIG